MNETFGEDMAMGPKLRGVRRYVVLPMGTTDASQVPEADRGESFWFWCRGCGTHHRFRTKLAKGETGPVWSWNGSMDRPTFSPSLLYPGLVCHLFLRDGMVQYLGDCTHALAGQTVPVEPPA